MSRLFPIISISLLVLMILVGIFLWLPKYQNFSYLRGELKAIDDGLKEKEEHLSELRIVSEKLGEYSSQLSKIDSALPLEPLIPGLFNYFQNVSSANGLILENINSEEFSSLEGSPGIREIPFSLSVSGSYSSFKNLLSSLYFSARLIEVESVSFSSEEEGGFQFDLEMKTYAYQEKAAVEAEILEAPLE